MQRTKKIAHALYICAARVADIEATPEVRREVVGEISHYHIYHLPLDESSCVTGNVGPIVWFHACFHGNSGSERSRWLEEVEPAAMGSTYETKKARRVFIFKNGSKNAEPRCLVLNERQIRNFSSFLTRVTSSLCATVAVRNIYTPTAGHLVNSLDGLKGDHCYVAGGKETFKNIGYVFSNIEYESPSCKLGLRKVSW